MANHPENTRRVILALAGYNDSEDKKYEENRKTIKEVYKENLLDGTNKHAIVIDELTGKRTFDYLLDNIDAIGNSHLVVVGNKESLESMIAEHKPESRITVIQQGKSLPENIYKAYTEGKKVHTQESIEARKDGVELSSQLLVLLADHFMAKPESILAAAEVLKAPYMINYGFLGRKQKIVVPDVGFGYCSRPEGNDERLFFSDRKFWEFGDGDTARLSGIIAINMKENEDDLVSGRNLSILENAYGARKALAFASQMRIAGMAIRYAPGFIVRHVTNNLSADYFSRVASKVLRTDFRLGKVNLDLEPDIDSEEDVMKARKMFWLKKYDNWTTLRDCYEFINRYGNRFENKIKVIGSQIEDVPTGTIMDQLDFIKFGGRTPFYTDDKYKVNQAACLYYDLAKSIHKDNMRYAAAELESFHRK